MIYATSHHALVDRAQEHAATIMPGFTHLQTAQPITSTTGRPATSQAPATTVRSRTRPSTTELPTAGRQATTTAAPAGPDQRAVPSVVGLHREQAADVLARAQLEVQVLRVPVQESGQVQRVIAQRPEAGQLAPAGSEVTLLVGSKRPTG